MFKSEYKKNIETKLSQNMLILYHGCGVFLLLTAVQ